jgi:hypothetical protein
LKSKLSHETDIFSVPMVVIARYLSGIRFIDGALLLAKHVPNTETFVALGRSAFDLIRSSGRSPDKILRKLIRRSGALS